MNKKSIKTNEDIDEMINTLQAELNRLPTVGLLGANAESIKESKQWIKELQDAKKLKFSSDKFNDVFRWYSGLSSSLDAYDYDYDV